MNKCLPYIEGLAQRCFDSLTQHAIVSHFPARARLQLPVQVKLGSRVLDYGFPIGRAGRIPKISKKINHYDGTQQVGRSKGQTANRSQLLFKLACYARIKCIVAGVMRTRSKLID